MAQVGTVEVVATIDTSRYKRGAKEVVEANNKMQGSVGSADSSLGKLNKRLSGMARTGLKVATTGFVALAGTITAMTIKGGISRALNIEDAQAKLKGLGHDAKSVTTIMESALASVKGTAYGLDAAATIAASAVAAGVKPGQELTKYLSLTADAATIAGVSLDEMGSVFNKVQTGQKAYTQELNQLADRGIPIYQWLQKELGVTQKELRKMVAAGEVDSATYFKAIEKNIGGAALESGKTTRGAWQNMLAAMSRVGERIVKGPIDTIRDGFGNMTKWIDNNSDNIVNSVQRSLDIMLQFGRGVVQVGRFLWNIRPIVAGVVTAWAAYRATLIALNTVKAISNGLFVVQVTWLKLQTAASMLASGMTIKQTAAQVGLNLAMKANPIGLVIGLLAGLAAIIATVIGATDRSKSATDRLNAARQTARDMANNLKEAEDRLRGANLSQEGATLAVERAQRNYNEALENYGRDSLEAREAAYQLRQAQNDLREANKRVKDETEAVNKAEKDLAKSREDIVKANNGVKNSAYDVAGGYQAWTKSVKEAINEDKKKGVFGIGKNEANAVLGINRRFLGGPVSAGRGYLVGENRDGSINDTTELFVPNSSGRIINSKDLQSALSGGGGGGSNSSTIEINVSGVFATSKQEQRNIAELIATRLQEVQKSKAIGGGTI